MHAPRGVVPRKVIVALSVVGIVCVLVFTWWWWFRCGATATAVIVRHADRAGTADALSPAGIARAQELVHVGEKLDLAAIYRSDTERARATAEPLATALGITPVVYPASDVDGLVSTIQTGHRGQTVFIVGHSNTVPQIVAALGGPTLPEIAASEFDDLLVVNACGCKRRRVSLVRLQYGATSP